MDGPRQRIVITERHLKLTPRTCATCARAFHGWGRQRFCSLSCQRRWDYLRHAESRRAKRRERYRVRKPTADRPAEREN